MNRPRTSDHAHTGHGRYRLVAATVGLALLTTLTGAACNDKPAGPSAPPPVAYPVSPKAPFTFTLKAPPDRWEITFQNGRVQLRDPQEFQIGYRIDAKQKAGDSELVKNNKAQGERAGWKMEPVTVDGAAGYKAQFAEGGSQRLFWFFAKDSVTGTLAVDLGTAGDAQMVKAAEDLIASWKWKDPALTGAWPMPDPALPFSYVMPAQLAGQKQSATLRDFRYNLWWGKQPVVVVTSQGEDPAGTKKFYEDKKASLSKSGATIRKFDDPATSDAELAKVAALVDEGFTIKITSSETKQPAVGAVFLVKGSFYTEVSWAARGTTPGPTELPALTAPFDIARTLTFRDPW